MKINKECKNCGNMFITEYKHRDKQFCDRNCYFEYAKKNKLLGKKIDGDLRESRNCLVCDTSFTVRKKDNRKICSDECRKIWGNNPINKEKRLKKSKKVLKEKYGTDTFFNTKEFKENYSNYMVDKYGVNNPMKEKSFVKKLQETIRNKHLKNLIPNLKENNLILIDKYKSNKNGSASQPYLFKCNKCNHKFTSTLLGSGKIPICRKCNPITKNSGLELIIKDFLNQNNINYINNNRSLLDGKEIDIFLPDHSIGIEINGNYYHSEMSGNKNKKYHLEKSLMGQKKNIKIIHIFEDELLLKQEIVFSRLKSVLGLNKKIYGRHCEVKVIEKKISKEFLNKHHIQGDTIDLIRYGIFHEEKLKGVMTFGKKRKSLGNKTKNDSEWELVRFSNLKDLTIVGGFSKLLTKFIKDHKPTSIITYADIRWSGIDHKKTVYNKNGFEFIEVTPPNYWYIDTKLYLNRYHRFKFRKDVLVNAGYSSKKTEWEIMKSRNFDRIWDCGSMKFILKNPT